MQIILIELILLHFKNSQDISPLSLRCFSTHFVPIELGQDRVFGSGDKGLNRSVWNQGFALSALKLSSVKRSLVCDKDIHFEHAGSMYDVETRLLGDGGFDHLLVNEKICLKSTNKVWQMF